MKTTYLIFFLFLSNLYSEAQEKNLALKKPVAVNSENDLFPPKNMVDGKITRNSKWMSGNVKPPHIVEIDLQKYCNINRILIHTGIPESERTPSEALQAAGFWSAKNFKLQYWDDANWTDIPNAEVHENRLTAVPFNFSPALNTFKIRFVCDDGEPISIMEIEIFGTETDRVVAGTSSSLTKKTERTADQDVSVRINNKVIGKTMKYVGYNQGYYVPGSNASGWIEYSNVNSLRVWTTLNSYVPLSAVQVDKTVSDVAEFDRRKEDLRKKPESNEYIKWPQLLSIYDQPEKMANTNPMVLSYVLSELKRLKIEPVLQIGGTDFNETWSNKWQQWQRFYALAYYAAKEGDVTMFAMQNEPNHKNSGPMKLNQWISGMQIVSDALTSAIEDVNIAYGKKLKARMVGPVTAGNNPEWWTAVAKNLRTDYHGNKIDHDLLGIFSTHSYNSPAAGYKFRVQNISKLLADNQPGGKALPVVFTEIGRWMNAYLIDKEETMDSPSLFTEWAGIYTNNTLNGAYGMWAFKFSNTSSETYDFGVKSGHHFTWQGQRIVEDAYNNLALNKSVKTSNNLSADMVTDGIKTDQSAWISDSTTSEKWVEIDLGSETKLGSAVVYTGSASGVYTAPDRVRNFKLQYFDMDHWNDIPGFVEKGNKYAQVFHRFKSPVSTKKVRFISSDTGRIKIREIKLFGENDGPAREQKNYDVSGIQRAGEVVRLFAKSFKNEKALLETKTNVEDENFDAITCYDSSASKYFVWLVQRGLYKNNVSLDLSALSIPSNAVATAESVGPDSYGEVTGVFTVDKQKKIKLQLPAQSVMLLTIPSDKLQQRSLVASEDAIVSAGSNNNRTIQNNGSLSVGLDASKGENNKVAYIKFDLKGKKMQAASRVMLKLNGFNKTDTTLFRVHVYAIPDAIWSSSKLMWKTAHNLDAVEALIKEVGRKAFVAGEVAFNQKQADHYLDVTELMKNHPANAMTFVVVRETRQMGDDIDKGKELLISSSLSAKKPELIYWEK